MEQGPIESTWTKFQGRLCLALAILSETACPLEGHSCECLPYRGQGYRLQVVTWPSDGAFGGWGSKYYRDKGYNVVVALHMFLIQGDRVNTHR